MSSDLIRHGVDAPSISWWHNSISHGKLDRRRRRRRHVARFRRPSPIFSTLEIGFIINPATCHLFLLFFLLWQRLTFFAFLQWRLYSWVRARWDYNLGKRLYLPAFLASHLCDPLHNYTRVKFLMLIWTKTAKYVNSSVSRFSHKLFWKFPMPEGHTSAAVNQERRKLQEELSQKLFTKPWYRAIAALCIPRFLATVLLVHS